MPRLLAGGPGLGVSPSVQGRAYLAVAGSGKLTLLDANTSEEVAATHLAGEAIDVGFARTAGELRVVAFAGREGVTDARSFTVPGLDPAGLLELTGATRPMAFVADRILVHGEGGERPRIVTVTPKLVTVDPIALPEPVQAAAPAEEDRLVVVAHDRVEGWDPVLRRVMIRINLPAAKARQAGFAARRRFFWIASPTGIEVFRFSDGRMQLHIELGRRFVAADGDPESNRLVVASRAGEEPIVLEAIDLVKQERRALKLDPHEAPASFCVLEGAAKVVALADSDARVRFIPLEVAADEVHAVTGRTRPRSATPPVAVHAGGEARPLDWRARLGQGGDFAQPPRDPRLPTVRVEEGERAVPARPRADAPSTSSPSASVRETTASPERALEPALDRDWRAQLARWGAERLAAPESTTLPPDCLGSPLVELYERFSLGPHARAVLALLYAARLLGRGRGLPIATLGLVDGPGWEEALGTGELGAAELVRARRGKLKLRGAVARLLDGWTPAEE